MRWPLVKSKKFVSVPILVGVLVSSANAVDDERLWLSASHSLLFIDLKEAALAAENLERCVSVVEGTIDLDDSKPGHPIYRILCQQKNRRTYNEMVDGISFATLTTKIEVPVLPSENELEALRIAEEKRKQEAKDVRIESLSSICEQAINDKTRLMKGVVWLTALPVQPIDMDETSARFTVDFDAKDIHGGVLKYRANCYFADGDKLTLRVSARKNEK